MAKLPVISGMKAVKTFNKAGWIVSRQTGVTSSWKKLDLLLRFLCQNIEN